MLKKFPPAASLSPASSLPLFSVSEARPGRRMREMVPGQDESDPDDHANDKADHETKAGRVLNGAFAQVENAGRLVLVHT